MWFVKERPYLGWGAFSVLEKEREFWSFVNDYSEASLKYFEEIKW